MRGLRAELVMPLIVLSGNSTTIDKVVCLELGADDYVTKPFEPRELLARIRTVLRRATGAIQLRDGSTAPAPGSVVSFAGWRVDLTRRELTSPAGQPVALTGHEFELLAALLRYPGHVLSRERILDLVAKRDYSPYDRSIDVLVGRLRRKLGDDARAARMIKTIRGAGYMFVPPAEG